MTEREILAMLRTTEAQQTIAEAIAESQGVELATASARYRADFMKDARFAASTVIQMIQQGGPQIVVKDDEQ